MRAFATLICQKSDYTPPPGLNPLRTPAELAFVYSDESDDEESSGDDIVVKNSFNGAPPSGCDAQNPRVSVLAAGATLNAPEQPLHQPSTPVCAAEPISGLEIPLFTQVTCADLATDERFHF